MSILASSLITLLFLLTLLFTYVVFSLTITPVKQVDTIRSLVKLPGISLCSSYLGNRILEYKIDNNVVYMGVAQNTYADFVYAK